MLKDSTMASKTRLIAINTLETTDNEAVKALCRMWLARFKQVNNERIFYAKSTEN